MFESALYYPTIDIHNTTWLKSAVLFWDRIETIVPESEEHPYRKRTTQLLQEEGILFAHKVNPLSEDVRTLEQDVIKFLKTPEGKKSFTKPVYGPTSSIANRRLERFEMPAGYCQTRREQQEHKFRDIYRDFYIHVEKLPSMLSERLDICENEDGYVLASRGFMSFYMTLLANRICQNNRMALLTDKVNQNNLSNKFFSESLTPLEKNDENRIKRGTMYQVIMDDIKIESSTPMERIIQFKRDRKYELASFRAEMDKLTAFDTDGMTAKDLEHEIRNIYMRQVQPSLDAIKAALNDARINWLSNSAAYIISGALSCAFAGVDIMTNIAIAAGEGLGLFITSVPYIKKRIELDNCPYSYLLKMNQQFSVIGKDKLK